MQLISFLYPNFLWFLLLIPLFVLIYFLGLAYNKKKAIMFSNFKAIERFYGIEFFNKNFLFLYLNLFVLIILILSLAGTHISFEATTSSYSYVILIDNSQSMSADDIKPNRFNSAKEASKRFVNSLPLGVNIGVIGFSGSADIYQEITTDKMLVKMAIDNMDYSEVSGTNIYSAIITAQRLFEKNNDNKLRSIILISDGQVNVGETPQIISLAQRSDLIINTIIIGTHEGGETTLKGFVSKADIDFMKALAFNSNGHSFIVEQENDFNDFITQLTDNVEDIVTINISLYLLIAALILFTLNWILYSFRFRIFP